MKPLTPTTWPKIFKSWKQREAKNPAWIHCATKIKGWPNWESWRQHSASQIKANQRKWQIHEFTDPFNEIPAMLVGPYSGWQSKLPQKNVSSFQELLEIPEQYQQLNKNDLVTSLIDCLPFTTEFIGILREDLNKIVCLEGHHRATAIALAQKQGKNIDFSKVKITIALANLPKNQIHLLDEMLKRGSSAKIPPE